MSLGVLVLMVVLGLALAIGAVRFSGLSHPARLLNEGEAWAAFSLDFPDEKIGRILLSEGGQAAFLILDSGRIGLVLCFGSKTVTRLLTPAMIAGVERRGATVSARFPDFTLPGVEASFASADDAAALEALLKGRRMTEEQHA